MLVFADQREHCEASNERPADCTDANPFLMLAGLSFLASALSIAAPRLAPAFLGLLGLVLIALAWRQGARWRELARLRTLLFLLLAVSAYTLLSAVWSPVPGTSVEKAALFAAFSMLTLGAVSAIDRLEATELRLIASAVIAGTIVGAAYVMLEVLTEGRITVTLMNLLSVFRPENAKHVRIEDGVITDINMSRFNHHATMVILFLWPTLLLMKETLAGLRRSLIGGLFLVLVVVAVFLSEHDSSQLAIIVSLIAWGLAKTWPRAVIRGMALLWCLGFVVIIPLVHLAYNAGLHKAESLPSSFRARIIIWDYTRERALNTPLIGIGAGATRVESKPRSKAKLPPGFVFPRATGQHAHNIFLQTWFELGLVGAILFALLGAAAIVRILLLPPEVQPFAAASFAAFGVIASFAWSMWQTWWVCAIGLMIIYLCLGAALLRRPGAEGALSNAKEPIRDFAR